MIQAKSNEFCVKFGGDGGIRTHGTNIRYTHFPSVLIKPLSHVSLSNIYLFYTDFRK